jgi:hypothetical protein
MKQIGWIVLGSKCANRVTVETEEDKIPYWEEKGMNCIPIFVEEEHEEIVGFRCNFLIK